jgi:hypothetical protein
MFLREVYQSRLVGFVGFLHTEQLELFSLNLGVIVLRPKVNKVERIQRYRLNVVSFIKIYQGHYDKAELSGWQSGSSFLDCIYVREYHS